MKKSNKKCKNIRFNKEVRRNEFRVTIFGSARIKQKDKVYKQVFDFAHEIGELGFGVVTGGGPGLMEAANAGHEAGDKKKKAYSIGLPIQLPWEARENRHLEIKRLFNKFSGRLDNFMKLSKVVVIMPGGVGTCLEFFYTWQLVQVRHIKPLPMILIGHQWKKLMDWVKKYPLKMGLISPDETKHIYVAKNNAEAMKIILKTYKEFENARR